MSKRTLDELNATDLEVPVAAPKKPRLALPSLKDKWHLVTSGQDGACLLIIAWDPRDAPRPEEAAAALHAAFVGRGTGMTGDVDLTLHEALSWIRQESEDEEKPRPAGFATGLERSDFGSFEVVCPWGDAGGLCLNGPVFFYSSWC